VCSVSHSLNLGTYVSKGTKDNNNDDNNNNNDDIYSAVIVAEPLREFTRFTR